MSCMLNPASLDPLFSFPLLHSTGEMPEVRFCRKGLEKCKSSKKLDKENPAYESLMLNYCLPRAEDALFNIEMNITRLNA